jgi:hypothetical protein
MEARRRVLARERFGNVCRPLQWCPRKAGPFFSFRVAQTHWLTSRQSKSIDRPSLVGTLIKDASRYTLSDRESAWVAAMT